MNRHKILRIVRKSLAVAASGLASMSVVSMFMVTMPVAADLGWFGRDVPTQPPQPIRMSEVIAWSDACLSVEDDQWNAILRIHREYLDSWRVDPGSTLRNRAAEQRFLDALSAALGEERAACVAAFRAWRTVPTRIGNDPAAAAKLRREMLALAAAPADGTPASRLDTQRIAKELCERMTAAIERGETRARDELVVLLRALLPLRPRLVELIGQEHADRLQRTLLLRADIVQPVLCGERTRVMLGLADRLSPDERAAIAQAYARADAMIDKHLLDGEGLPAPSRDGDTAELRSAFERAWLSARLRSERLVAEELERILGAERLGALRMLELDGVSRLDGSEAGNAAADAALAQFVDPARFDEVARALGADGGDRPWHPMKAFPLGEDEQAALGMPTPIARELLLAAVAPALRDDATRAVGESLHAAHVARVDEIRGSMQSALDALDRMANEDERLFTELAVALGPERADAARIELVRLARIELRSPPRPAGLLVDGIWLQSPSRVAASIAMLALGVQQRAVLPLSEAEQARLRVALVPLAAEWTKLLRAESRSARADEPTGQDRAELVARVGRDAGRARLALERIQRLVDALRAATDVDEPASDVALTAADAVLLAAFEPPLDDDVASQRLDQLLLQEAAAATALGSILPARMASVLRISDSAAQDRLRKAIAECRAIERLATRSDDDSSARACEASSSWIMRTHEAAWRREEAIADAWRLARDAGVPEAKDAFRP